VRLTNGCTLSVGSNAWKPLYSRHLTEVPGGSNEHPAVSRPFFQQPLAGRII